MTLKHDCRVKKKVDQMDKNGNEIHVSEASGSDSDGLTLSCESQVDTLWIFDTGASFHATSTENISQIIKMEILKRYISRMMTPAISLAKVISY